MMKYAMYIDRLNIETAKARLCLGTSEMLAAAGLSTSTYNQVCRTGKASPKTIGKLASALGVDPKEIIREEN